jgi:uncharacterized membrane-anchored protein
MREDHVPSIGPRFWVVLTIASVFGANLADLLTAHLAVGFAGRMLVFAALLAAILIGERYDRSRTEACYWMGVVVVQAASAKLADFSAIDLGLGRLVLVAGLAVLLMATFRILRSHTMLFVSTHMISRSGAAARPLTDAAHWTAMVLASTLGAAASDFFTVGLGLGPFHAALIVSVLLAASFGLYRLPSANRLFMFWLASTAIRALGTAVGDLLAENADLSVTTALDGVMLVALLLLWPKPRLHS